MSEHKISKWKTIFVGPEQCYIRISVEDKSEWTSVLIAPDQARAIAADLVKHADELQEKPDG